MAGPGAERQRVAILSANLVGLDRLAHLDYEAAVRRLNDDLDALARIIARHRGILTVVSADGADITAALPRPLGAVRAGFELLDLLAKENAALPAAQHLECRIGLDFGEITIAGDDLSGEPVQVAAGLKALARPGTVLVTHVIFRRIKPRLHFAYRTLGERAIEGVSRPVRHYQIKKIGAGAIEKRGLLAGSPAAAAAVVLVAAVGGSAWYAYHNLAAAPADRVTAALPSSGDEVEPAQVTPADETRLAAPTERPPDRAASEGRGRATPDGSSREEVDLDRLVVRLEPPDAAAAQDASTTVGDEAAVQTAMLVDDLKQQNGVQVAGDEASIAVLPFADLENEGASSYFSEGVAEGLVRYLGRFPHVTVLASSSSFDYPPQEQDAVKIAAELGATHLVRGSAGRTGNEMVVRSELIEAASGEPVWAEAFELRSDNPGAAQQQLAQRILASLEGREAGATAAELADFSRAGTLSLTAYDYALQWRDLFEASRQGSNQRARQAAIRALELDPGYAAAYAYVAWTFMAEYWWRWSPDPSESLRQAQRWAEQAIELDHNSLDAQWALGDVQQALGNFDRAIEAYEAALAINPNAAELLQDLGTWMLPLQGRASEGLELARKSMRLHPHHPEAYYGNISLNFYLLNGYTHVVEHVNRMLKPRLDHLLYLAASYAQMDRELEAKLVIAHVVAENPNLTVDGFLDSLPFKDEDDAQHLREGLVKAGLPA